MEGKSEIVVILNKYKNTLDDFIDSLDTEFLSQPESLNQPEPIDKGTRNMGRSRGALTSLSEENCLNEDVLITLLGLTPKIQDVQVYKCHNIVSLSCKSGKVQDKEG